MDMTIQTTQKSSFSARFRNIFSRNYGITLLYLVLCFVGYPLIMMLMRTTDNYIVRSDSASEFFSFGIILMGGLAILFSMILSTKLFGFMHNRASADVYYSLPVKRGETFWTNYLVGILLITAPLILNSLAALIFYGGGSVGYFFIDFFLILLTFLLSVVEFFTFCVFFHVTCGTSFGANLYNLLLNVGYLASVGIIMMSLNGFLPGYTEASMPITVLLFLAPIGRVFSGWVFVDSQAQQFGGQDLWIHLVILAVVLLLSYFLFLRRKSESAGSSFAFSLPKHVLRFIVTTGGALFFAFIFYAINGGLDGYGNVFYIFFGAVIGGALTHVILELIFSKGFGTLLKSLPALGVFFAVFVTAYCFLAGGWFGYDTWVPNAGEVKSVSVYAWESDYYKEYEEDGEGYVIVETDPSPEEDEEFMISEMGEDEFFSSIDQMGIATISQPENIEKILALHKLALRSFADYKPYSPGCYVEHKILSADTNEIISIDITYEMKNGTSKSRHYYLERTPEAKKLVDELRYSSENYLYYLGFNENYSWKISHRVSLKKPGETVFSGMEKSKQNEFLPALKSDLKNLKQSYQESSASEAIWVEVEVNAVAGEYEATPETWQNRLKIDPEQFPQAYALLKAYNPHVSKPAA